MDVTTLIFLSSGLFLGWSLGSNDAANVFGTAVGSRMVRFVTAAILCSVFVILGAVVSGAGAAHGLGQLGAVNALPGSFVVACAAGLTVYGMTKASLPVSATQAIVGAIIGWNVFSGSRTDMGALTKIVGTWVACPILGAVFSAVLYTVVVRVIYRSKLHLLRLDAYTRAGLIVAGILGAYSLGANNIANVMGVFVSSSPFTEFRLAGLVRVTSVQQLFLLGGVAIAVGVFTYSKRVMMTVGTSLMPLNPVAAFVVVVSHSLVLLIFSSQGLASFLVSLGLPPIPLIPVSSSQAVIGAVIGIGLLHGVKGARQIRWGVLLKIASAWVTTPILAAVMSLALLFVVQNVFNQRVYQQVHHELSEDVLARLARAGLPVEKLAVLKDANIAGAIAFRNALREQAALSPEQEELAISSAEVCELRVTAEAAAALDDELLTAEQRKAVAALAGLSFRHKWQLLDALTARSDSWKKRPGTAVNRPFNKRLDEQLDALYRTCRAPEE
ncbi:MAG TPA: inorganic phosphate transporter [Planctomycetota bacterium]|nr:inorganic phosphate transporter [Planctomycetota bacterium]